VAIEWVVEDWKFIYFPPLYEMGIYLLSKLVQNWYKAGVYLKFANQWRRYEVGIASGLYQSGRVVANQG
jgi:hypothetical protein